MTDIGVLALQGDFIEHEAVLHRLGACPRQVRRREELEGLDGLIIPGGESTTFCRLMQEFGLYEPLRTLLSRGIPVWGTCAGLIVLARQAADLPFPTLGALDASVRRNAYGRQVESFEADLEVPALGDGPFPAVFIRAPVVESVGPGVEVLAALPGEGPGGGRPVALRQGSVLGTAFHPELTEDPRFHRYFLEMVRSQRRQSGPK